MELELEVELKVKVELIVHRHTGQGPRWRSHGSIQGSWNTWPHACAAMMLLPPCNDSRHIGQSPGPELEVEWLSVRGGPVLLEHTRARHRGWLLSLLEGAVARLRGGSMSLILEEAVMTPAGWCRGLTSRRRGRCRRSCGGWWRQRGDERGRSRRRRR